MSTAAVSNLDREDSNASRHWGLYVVCGVLFAELVALYSRAAAELYDNWTLTDTYYAHSFLIPFVSGYFVWRDRAAIRSLPILPSAWGLLWILKATALLLVGDFLGFRVLGHLSILPMVTGLSLLIWGTARTRRIWFPLVYLIFMIPIPPSVTQSVALELKLMAARIAVTLANWFGLPIVQMGSSIHFRNDSLLVGDVCGGLRSLVALLALGAIMAYVSELRAWAKWVVFALAGPIAIAANVFRIFVLCVAGYFWGSAVAAGWVHTVSGFGIFVVAILLFLAVLVPLRLIASPRETAAQEAEPFRQRPMSRVAIAFSIALLACATMFHWSILTAQASAPDASALQRLAAIPDRIVDYRQAGVDEAIDDRTRRILETSTILIRHYAAPSGRPVQLTIVYAGTTRRSLHFPEVCLVGDGWEIRERGTQPVGLTFTANQLVLVKGDGTQAVLYWFKTGDELTGNFFLNAWYWAKNQMQFGSPTSAMIKLATPVGVGGEEAAFAALGDFAAKLTAILDEYAQ